VQLLLSNKSESGVCPRSDAPFKSNFRRRKRNKVYSASTCAERFLKMGVKSSVKRKLDFILGDVSSFGDDGTGKICKA
jgi:hypothetical protein